MSARRITILRKGLFVLALPLVYQALFIALLYKRQADIASAQQWAMHTKDVIEKTDRVFQLLLSSQSELRGYVLTGDRDFVAEISRNEAALRVDLQALREMIRDNPQQEVRFQRVLKAAEAKLGYQQKLLELTNSEGVERARDDARGAEGKRLMRDFRSCFDDFRREEEKLDGQRLAALGHETGLQNGLLIGGLILNIGIGAVAAIMFSREMVNRVLVVIENTKRMSRGEPLAPLLEGSDEISELDAHFHSLADHLKRAGVRERVYQESLERRAGELARANKDLAEKNQEIEMFVYSVSHDLRSPLVNLQGFSQELGRARDELQGLVLGEITDQQRQRARMLVENDMTESVGFIKTAVTRLSSIIDALLRLSRAGRVEYRPRKVNVAAMVREIVASMRGTTVVRGAEIVVGDLSDVWADPSALEQIFANLIGNALNYLDPKRPGRIEVGEVSRAVEGVEKPRVYFVKDNGLGISEKYLHKVFAIFQRLHGEVAVGEGVGLALVRRVVERHGGKVWVESTEGMGSTFFVALPSDSGLTPIPISGPRKERIHPIISQV